MTKSIYQEPAENYYCGTTDILPFCAYTFRRKSQISSPLPEELITPPTADDLTRKEISDLIGKFYYNK